MKWPASSDFAPLMMLRPSMAMTSPRRSPEAFARGVVHAHLVSHALFCLQQGAQRSITRIEREFAERATVGRDDLDGYGARGYWPMTAARRPNYPEGTARIGGNSFDISGTRCARS
jgi:hypothetical protein